MSYQVLATFEEKGHKGIIYKEGEIYPKAGFKADPKRVAFLQENKNKYKRAFLGPEIDDGEKAKVEAEEKAKAEAEAKAKEKAEEKAKAEAEAKAKAEAEEKAKAEHQAKHKEQAGKEETKSKKDATK